MLPQSGSAGESMGIWVVPVARVAATDVSLKLVRTATSSTRFALGANAVGREPEAYCLGGGGAGTQDVRGRQQILEHYLADKPVADDVNAETLARSTPGFSGADLFNLVNIAAIQAAVQDAEKISTRMMEYAKDRIMMGYGPRQAQSTCPFYASIHLLGAKIRLLRARIRPYAPEREAAC